MTEEKIEEIAKTGHGIHVNHWCSYAGCNEWGGFGFAATIADTPQWWCWEHYHYKRKRI